MRKNQDGAMKILEEHNDVFADICNVVIYDGQQIVKPEDLKDASTNSSYVNDGKLYSQTRDVAKYWKKGNTLIKIARFGIENQSTIDKDMPLRMISYDGAAYRWQVKNTKERYPVASIVLYTGDQKWKSPHSIYDAIKVPDELKPFVSNYKINVFQLAHVTKDQVEKFQSVFQNLADYYYHKTNNLDYHGSTKPLTHTEDFINAITEITGDKRISAVYNKETDDNNQEVNMCTLMDRVVNKSHAEGKEEGREEGKVEGANENAISIAKTMLEKNKYSNEEIADITNLPLEKIKELAAEVCVGVTK